MNVIDFPVIVVSNRVSCIASLNIFIYSGSNGPSVGPKVYVDSFDVIRNTSFAISGVDVTYFIFTSCRIVLFLTVTPNNSDRPFRRRVNTAWSFNCSDRTYFFDLFIIQ